MPLGLSSSKVDHSLAVKISALFKHDLHGLVIPFGYSLLDVAFYRVGGVRVQRPISIDGGGALVVPHADSRARCVTEKADGVGISAAMNTDRLIGLDSCC